MEVWSCDVIQKRREKTQNKQSSEIRFIKIAYQIPYNVSVLCEREKTMHGNSKASRKSTHILCLGTTRSG